MSRFIRRAARVDESQQAIVDALRAAGAGVEIIGYPVDLLVSYRGAWHVIDCKTPARERTYKTPRGEHRLRMEYPTKRSADQVAFAARHHAPVHFAATPGHALAAIGAPGTKAALARACSDSPETEKAMGT